VSSRKQLPEWHELNSLYEYDNGSIISRRSGKTIGHQHNGYTLITYKGKKLQAHRVIWKLVYKTEPPQIIDHINRDRSDNRIENLRAATASENALNTDRLVEVIEESPSSLHNRNIIKTKGLFIDPFLHPELASIAFDMYWDKLTQPQIN